MSSVADLQASIVETRARRGFVTDPLKLLALLTEEVGEVASEIKGVLVGQLWRIQPQPAQVKKSPMCS